MSYGFIDPSGNLSEGPEGSGEQNTAYSDWLTAMEEYAQESDGPAERAHRFWVLLRLEGEGFSEQIEYLESPPMWVPKKGAGKLAGIAAEPGDVDKIIRSTLDASTGKNRYVYLVFAVKIQGQQAWQGLLEYLGAHNMLERY